ncbi:MAG: lysophospholipid acyltransferase family protein [Megasphaera sp.]|nr:lysophospholipid acyltransferase family protein [Megasphaera sp.]MCI1248053.1 lysophospholipid acyltransferase family protein [Megasphaera sp.]
MYIFMKCLSFFICHIPEYMRRSLGSFLGSIFWLFCPGKRKRLAQKQIMDCGITDDAEKAAAIAKASTVRFGPMIIEVLSYPRYTKESLERKITWHGKEYLDQVRDSGEGLLFVTSHAGNWEILGAGLAMEGYPLISVAQQQNSKSADKFINEYRTMMKQHVTYKTGIRDMIRLLMSGHYIGLLMDQDPGYTGIMVRFFGKDTLTADGAAKLAGINNSPIVLGLIHSDGPYHHVIDIMPPVRIYDSESKLSKEEKKKIVYDVTQKLNDLLETHIRKYPEEWFWLHNRWKWTRRLKEKKAEKEARAMQEDTVTEN